MFESQEDLKLLAESMGYEATITGFNGMGVSILHKEAAESPEYWELYNPLTNNDQMVEIMEKFKFPMAYCRTSNHWLAYKSRGKTINEAVLNAVIALVESSDE